MHYASRLVPSCVHQLTYDYYIIIIMIIISFFTLGRSSRGSLLVVYWIINN